MVDPWLRGVSRSGSTKWFAASGATQVRNNRMRVRVWGNYVSADDHFFRPPGRSRRFSLMSFIAGARPCALSLPASTCCRRSCSLLHSRSLRFFSCRNLRCDRRVTREVSASATWAQPLVGDGCFSVNILGCLRGEVERDLLQLFLELFVFAVFSFHRNSLLAQFFFQGRFVVQGAAQLLLEALLLPSRLPRVVSFPRQSARGTTCTQSYSSRRASADFRRMSMHKSRGASNILGLNVVAQA